MSERSSPSLLNTIAKVAIGGLAIGGAYIAYQNREKITEATAPARRGIAAWWKRVMDSALGDDRARDPSERRKAIHAA